MMATIYYTDPLLDEVASKIPEEVCRRTDLMMDIPYRINEILCRKGWNQADLAKAMGKKESEISKWLSGAHNFTITTIAKIMARPNSVLPNPSVRPHITARAVTVAECPLGIPPSPTSLSRLP